MTRRFPAIARVHDDAPEFADSVDRIVAGHVFRYRPDLVCLIRIKRWFDHRWLGYSGNGRVHFDTTLPRHPGVSLEEHFQEQMTFPPFVPTRVASERHWQRQRDGDYEVTAARFDVHRPHREHSSANLQRRIVALTDSALFVWFSSTSQRDRRGSVLVYVVNEGNVLPWFASIAAGATSWRLADVKGLGRIEVAELLEHPPLAR